jgi:nicotinamidase-related amidase
VGLDSMGQLLFWDVDTQVDFMLSGKPLYVAGAEQIIPALAALTNHARRAGIRVLGSEDWHSLTDPEISDDPDWRETYPPHCLAGSEGQLRVAETMPADPLYIDSTPVPAGELTGRITRHQGEILFRKQRFDVFSNPNVEPVLDLLRPAALVVYGVALDVCVRDALQGFLRRGREELFLVTDAIRALDSRTGEALLREWETEGVGMLTSYEILEGSPFPERLGAR